MPAFVLNGPHIPDDLSDALEEGRVVFFCGAGISYPAGLPSFAALTKQVYDKLGYTKNVIEIQKAAMDRHQYDTALDLLERHRPNGSMDVRRAVAEILQPTLSLPDAKKTHEAILTLGATWSGKYHIITTNFDPIFEIVRKEMGLKVKRYVAPLMPPSKRSLDGLFYLHGLIEDPEDKEQLPNIVITSGDFGRAYLKERWAAQFVSETLRNFTVVFVGYSIDDPVMRYMMDALAADQRAGEPSIEMYAFAGYEPGALETRRNEWKAKNVTPLMYPIIDGEHTILHNTIREWARTYRDGIEGRKMLIQQHAGTVPLSDSRSDFAVGRVLWALNKELAAKHFATMDPCPPLEWLGPLSADQYLFGDLRRFGVPSADEPNDKLKFSYIRRYTPYHMAPLMALVSRGQTGGMFDGIMAWLAHWLCRHLDDPKLLDLFMKGGGHLHPGLAESIRRRLRDIQEAEGDPTAQAKLIGLDKKANPSKPMRMILQLYIDGRVREDAHDMDMYSWRTRFAESGPTPALRMQFRDLLTPCIIFRPRSQMFGEVADETKPPEKVRDVVNWELALAADHVHVALRDSFKGSDWRQVLPEFLPTASSLLKDAMDLNRMLGGANDRIDASYYHQPSVSDHEQNRRFHDWTALVEICRDGWVAVAAMDALQGLAYAHLWFATPYPIFKRLAFFCAAQTGSPVSVDVVLDWLLRDDGWWLFSVETQRETMRLLVSLAPRLDSDQRARLEAAVLRGAPRPMYKPEVTPEEWDRLFKYQVWHVLAKLRSAASLGEAAQARLDALQVENPTLKLDPSQIDEFPFSMSTGLGAGRTKKVQTPKPLDELITWLSNPPKHSFLEEDDWGERCRADFRTAMRALLKLAAEDVWPTEYWRTAIQVCTEDPNLKISWKLLARSLVKMPADVFNDLAHTLGYWLQAQAKGFKWQEERFFALCDRLLEVPDPEKETSMEPVTDALNSPGGYATQALLAWWYRQGLKDGVGLDSKLVDLFTKLSDRNNAQYRHARIFLTAQVITLFRVDEGWTKKQLIPLFDWAISTEDAVRAWAGYLWSPQLFLPWLSVVKAQFLETANHFDDLRDRDGDQYAHLLAFIALNPADVFTPSELAVAVAALPTEGLEHLLSGVADGLKGSGDKRDEYWRNRVAPFMAGIWPQDISLKSEKIAVRIAQICIEAGDQFPDALNKLGGWLQPIDFVYSVFHDLEEEGLCILYPTEALEFMHRLTSPKMRYLSEDFGTCLQQIARANAALKEDYRFKQLSELNQIKRG